MSEKKKSWLLSSIWLIALVPMVIAWVMAFTGYGLPEETRNNGDLVPAGLVVPQELIEAQNGEWALVVISDKCDELCQQQLYRLQQLYISMGKQAERLQPVWVSNDVKRQREELSIDIALADEAENPSNARVKLPGEMNFKKIVQINTKPTFQWFSQQDIHWQDQSIFLVDPNGTLVLRFNPELSGRKMMSDIKWLFKASRVG